MMLEGTNKTYATLAATEEDLTEVIMALESTAGEYRQYGLHARAAHVETLAALLYLAERAVARKRRRAARKAVR